jgi:hypothetical protein
MTLSTYRSHEPLYTVTVRHTDGEKWLRQFVRECQIQASVDKNRMHIFENHGLTKFQMKWKYSWQNVTVWDCWNRRHIMVD